MTRKLTQLRNLAILLLILEPIIIAVIYLFFPLVRIFSVLIYASIKNIILVVALIYLSYILDNNALSVADALDEDAKNSLIYGGIALLQYDDNRNITWVSDLFIANKVKIIGLKVLDWQPTLAGLFENEEVKMIDIKGKKFEAYNNEDTHMLYLKDVSEYISLQQDYEDQQICVAYITVDNFDETLENLNESTAAKVQSIARQTIIDWAVENGMIIRRYKTGGYVAVFNERIYRKQVENKFGILDSFKKKCLELDEVLTLSIGIGRGTRVLRELEELAASALQLTYSRGGDQVVIKSGKDNVRFFGGTTDVFEKSSKVRARVIAQSMAGIIKRSSNVFIMGHKFSDLDSLGASVAMARIVQAYNVRCNIILDFNSLEEKTANVAQIMVKDKRYDGLICSAVEAMERVGRDTLLIVVDNHKPSLAISNGLLETVKNKIIIDHHRRGEEFVDTPILTYLEPSASSTVELIVELYNYQNVDVEYNDLDATIMYAGILVDTNSFKQRVGVRTFQSAATLKELNADVVKAYELLEDSYEKTIEITNITKTAQPYREHILIAVCDNSYEVSSTSLAKSSNKLLEVSDVMASFSIGKISKNLTAISARSSRDINVQMIMEKMGGGGHFTMAACQIENKEPEEVSVLLKEAIDQYFLERGD
ncbi:MAG: DHH family phosphoesterase [Eggerthia catenaformis]|uniref:DHH family phosphoesterase n=1 Tax=Eggerthia catenaformis TaxID=31973 RepID=UPI003F9F4A4B